MNLRRLNSRAVLGVIGALGVSVCAHAQQSPCDRGLMPAIGSLPDNLGMVVGASGLDDLRTTPAARAAAAFVRECGLAPRSLEGWTALARALGTPEAQAFDDLLGRRAILAFSGRGESERFALMTVVSPDTEEQVRKRLEPVPREIERGRPMLSLENGAFELVTTRIDGSDSSGDCASLLVTPRGGGDLADELLPIVSGADARTPLSARAFWSRLAPRSAPSLVVLMLSDRSAADYSFASVTARGDTLRAEFNGTAATVLSSPIEQGLLKSGAWPMQATELLGHDARLLVAGYTQAPDGPIEPGTFSPATLLHRAIAVLRLPADVSSQIEGPAIFAVGEGDAVFSAAIPARDLSKFAPAVDAYARMFTKSERDRASPVDVLPHESVRVLTLGADSRLIAGAGPTQGAIAWCFTRDPASEKGGWWTLSFFSGERADVRSVAAARELSDALRTPSKDAGADRQVFRLSLKPSKLAPLLEGEVPAGKSLRWLKSVESSIRLDAKDDASGTIEVRFDTSLLEPG